MLPHPADADAVLVDSGQVVMLCWSYIVAVVTEPGRVPQEWTPFATAEVRTGYLGQSAAPKSSEWFSDAVVMLHRRKRLRRIGWRPVLQGVTRASRAAAGPDTAASARQASP